MIITLLTSASKEYWPLLETGLPSKNEYCLRHNIQLQTRIHQNMGNPWGEREIFMINALHTCDWLWFMGADTLIMNHTIDARKFIDEDYDFIIGVDYNGINNDTFLLRNCEKSFEFLFKVISYNTSLPDDQEAMKRCIEEMPEFRVKKVSQKLFNAYLYDSEPEYATYPKNLEGNFRDGDFVLHLAGIYEERMFKLLKEYTLRIVR